MPDVILLVEYVTSR